MIRYNSYGRKTNKPVRAFLVVHPKKFKKQTNITKENRVRIESDNVRFKIYEVH